MPIRLKHLPPQLGGPAEPAKKRKGAPVPLEKDVQRACLQWLALVGVFAFRVNSGAVTGEYKGKRRFMRFNTAAGCADIIGMLPGDRFNPPLQRAVFLAVEVKRIGNKPTAKQLAFLGRVQKAGGLAFVCYGVEDLQAKLRAEGCNL